MSGEDTTGGNLPNVLLDGQFRLVRLLARGGMAEAWLADEIALHRQVVVKIPKTGGTDNAQVLARFEREARNAAQFTHPNIATVYRVGHHEDAPFLVMEYVPGRSLLEIISSDHALKPERVAGIMSQLGSALDAAHAKGITHRDLHLSNVLLTADAAGGETVKLIDFGIAIRQGVDEQMITPELQVRGFGPFIAPEQFLGAFADARVDVYALGVLAMSMLAGWIPVAQHREVRVSDVPESERWPSIVREVLARALTADRSLRFPSAGAFVSALAAALSAMSPQISTVPRELAVEPVGASVPPPVTETEHHSRTWLRTPVSQSVPVIAPTPAVSRPFATGKAIGGASLAVLVLLLIGVISRGWDWKVSTIPGGGGAPVVLPEPDSANRPPAPGNDAVLSAPGRKSAISTKRPDTVDEKPNPTVRADSIEFGADRILDRLLELDERGTLGDSVRWLASADSALARSAAYPLVQHRLLAYRAVVLYGLKRRAEMCESLERIPADRRPKDLANLFASMCAPSHLISW
jgi:serine/threonine protein kinase